MLQTIDPFTASSPLARSSVLPLSGVATTITATLARPAETLNGPLVAPAV